MKSRKPVTKAILVAALALGLTPSVFSSAASSRGSISLLDPISQTAYSDQVPIAWEFTPGSKVRTTSSVYIQASTDRYRWYTIESKVPIRHGAYIWNTSDWPEGTYHLRSVVHRTMITDSVGPIVVDRSNPLAYITSPSEGDVVIEDALTVSTAVVAGTTTLEASTYDYGSGIESIAWALDEKAIGFGSPYRYNFSMEPGPHVLSVTVTDAAGNVSMASANLLAVPGPSLIVTEPSEPPTLPDTELPDPENPPTLPDPELPADPNNPPSAPENPPVPDTELPFDPENPPTIPSP